MFLLDHEAQPGIKKHLAGCIFQKSSNFMLKKTDIKESDKNDSFQSYTWREPYSSWAFTNELMNMNNLQISKIFICF